MDLILIIPYELTTLILNLSDTPSIFALSRTSERYLSNKIILPFLHKQTISSIHSDAVYNGHFDLFKWFVSRDDKINLVMHQIYLVNAIKHGRLDILKYLYLRNGTKCCLTNETINSAAAGGHLEILKYLHTNGCRCTSKTCYEAVRHGHVEVLKYLHDNGCSWDTGYCRVAAKNGHVNVLKYLRDNGCDWGEIVSCIAAEYGQLEVLKYLCENGYPLHKKSCRYMAEKCGYQDVLEYLQTIN